MTARKAYLLIPRTSVNPQIQQENCQISTTQALKLLASLTFRVCVGIFGNKKTLGWHCNFGLLSKKIEHTRGLGMTFHAPHSSARLVAIIARRLIFRKSNLIAAGAIVSASVVLAGRGSYPESDGPEMLAATVKVPSFLRVAGEHHPDAEKPVLVALASPIDMPRSLGRPWQNDRLMPGRASDDEGIGRPVTPAMPGLADQQDLDPAGIETTLAAPTLMRPSSKAPDTGGFEAPSPDWNSLESVMAPRFPDVGPVPLSPDGVRATGDLTPDIDLTPHGPVVKSAAAGSGETLEAILERLDVKEEDQQATLIALRADNVGEMITEGDRIDMAFSPDDATLLGIRLKMYGQEAVELRWDGETDPLWVSVDEDSVEAGPTIEAAELAMPTLAPTVDGTETKFVNGEITSSLYGAAQKAGMSARDTQRLSGLFSYIVDFQRDLRKGDRFEVLFEKTAKGENGAILYAKLTNRGSQIALYRGKNELGEYGYYDATGRSNKRALMRTPIAGAQVSSTYGMRRHPILGYNKMHRGVDFRAPSGTPIFAAGDGIIDYAGRRGTYGKYIRIRHNGTFKTAYAHLSRYAKHIKSGRRVKQGEVIGYVGSTGRSTGPHLHFEIIENDKRVNPMKVADFGPINGLGGSQLSEFKARVARTEIAIGLLRDNRYAVAE